MSRGRKVGTKVESYTFSKVTLRADAAMLAKLKQVQELAEVKVKREEILSALLADALTRTTAVEITALLHEAAAQRKARAEEVRIAAKRKKLEAQQKKLAAQLAELGG